MTRILYIYNTHERSKSEFNKFVSRYFSENDSVHRRIDTPNQIVKLDDCRYQFISLDDDIQRKVKGMTYDKIIIDEFATEEQVALLKMKEYKQQKGSM